MCRIFAEAVSGNVCRNQAFAVKHTERSHRSGKNRGLRDFRQAQLFFRTFKAELRQFVPEGCIGFVKGLLRDGIKCGEVFAHADGLGSLARKKECDSLR